MDEEDVVYTQNEILLNLKNKWNNGICSNMNVPRDGLGHVVSKVSQTKTSNIWYYLYVEYHKYSANELIYKTEIES